MPVVKKAGAASTLTLPMDKLVSYLGYGRAIVPCQPKLPNKEDYKTQVIYEYKDYQKYMQQYELAMEVYREAMREYEQAMREYKQVMHRKIPELAAKFRTAACDSCIQGTLHPSKKSQSRACLLSVWVHQVEIRQPDTIEQIVRLMQDCIYEAENTPVRLSQSTWLFKSFRYKVNGPYTDEEFRLLILEDFNKERRYLDQLKMEHTSSKQETRPARPRLSEQVRIEVWRRDNGQCTRCASRVNLEYDHIIPLSRGGSNTTRNIELLCEKCNRSKGSNIR